MNTSQIEFQATGAGKTQNELILAVLKSQPGQWVGLPELTEASHSWAIHARIGDLRKRGHDIRNRTERGENNQCRSYYKLEIPKAEIAKAETEFSPTDSGECVGSSCNTAAGRKGGEL